MTPTIRETIEQTKQKGESSKEKNWKEMNWLRLGWANPNTVVLEKN